jgi:ribose 5-phosphate isomerase RpiB
VDSAERIVAGMGWTVAFAADDENECVRAVVECLKAEHEVVTVDPRTWTGMSRAVAEQVVEGDCDFGVLMCWTGIDELADIRDIEP